MQTCATHSRVCAHDVPVQFKRFNISVSYYQVAALLCKDTKFGKTMVIKTAKYSGAYTLGFRIDPPERRRWGGRRGKGTASPRRSTIA